MNTRFSPPLQSLVDAMIEPERGGTIDICRVAAAAKVLFGGDDAKVHIGKLELKTPIENQKTIAVIALGVNDTLYGGYNCYGWETIIAHRLQGICDPSQAVFKEKMTGRYSWDDWMEFALINANPNKGITEGIQHLNDELKRAQALLDASHLNTQTLPPPQSRLGGIRL